jgi:hypothetical protein
MDFAIRAGINGARRGPPGCAPQTTSEAHPMAVTAEMSLQAGQDDVSPARVPDAAVTRLEPVKRLMLAVLERAVNDHRTYAAVPTARGRRLLAEVDAWFRSSTSGPFDFETICQATGLDPDFVRKGLGCSWGVHAGAASSREPPTSSPRGGRVERRSEPWIPRGDRVATPRQ